MCASLTWFFLSIQTNTNTQIHTVLDVCKLYMFFHTDAHLNDVTGVRLSSSLQNFVMNLWGWLNL